MPAFPKPNPTETDPVAGPNLTTHAALTTTAHGGIVASSDARLTDSRTPTAHKTTHATGGSDAIAPSDIGAATAAAAAAAQSTADGAVTLAGTKAAKASNLSDLTSASAARTNLGLGTAATHAEGDFASALVPNVAFDGDSLSSDGNGTLGAQTYYDAMPGFAVAGIDPRATLNSAASFGKTIATMITAAPAGVDPWYDAAKRSVLVMWGGTNDLGLGAASAATVISRISTYHAARRAAGWKTVAVTLLPRSDAAAPGTFEADRQTINTSIRANWATYADALADIAADTRIGDAGDSDDTRYYADKLHMTTAGYAIVGRYVKAALAECGVVAGAYPQISPQVLSNYVGAGSLGLGYSALKANTTGSNLTALGYKALTANTTGSSNTAVGMQALLSNTTGTDNTAVGLYALLSNTTGANNVAVGEFALMTNASSGGNVAVGVEALKVSTGSSNVAVGYQSLLANSLGGANTALGYQALKAMTTASNSTAVGQGALAVTTGQQNTAVGSFAGRVISTAADNVAIGYMSLYMPNGSATGATTTGTRQVGIGVECGVLSATQRNDIVAIGYRALVDAADTVAIGSGASAGYANSVALGKGIATTAANQVMIGPNDLEITSTTKGVVIKSPDGTRYRIQVANGGALSTVAA